MTERTPGQIAAFQRFIDDNLDHCHIEADIVKRIIAAFAAADNPIVTIFDNEEYESVDGERDILEHVFNLDECYLIPRSGGWVRIVLGNEWDCIVDYTAIHEDTLAPINRYINRHAR